MTTPLTTTDAFFVAYQESSGILMHFGSELEVVGELDRATVMDAVERVLARWPVLGKRIARGLGGLRWREDAPDSQDVLHETGDREELTSWRNRPVDPFREPPFGVLWFREGQQNHFGLRCHHSAGDGELFLAINYELLYGLSRAPANAPAESAKIHPLALGSLWKQAKLAPSVRHARWLAREAKADRGAHVALREATPGPIAMSDHRLVGTARDQLYTRARDLAVRPAWMVAAGWLKTLHAWNLQNGIEQSLLSLEVPVSLRRGSANSSGNHIAVLTLFADASTPLDALAKQLWRDYAAGVRRRDHLAVPLLANPVRLLPWKLFRKVAVTPSSTGFATSHFTWIGREPDVHGTVTDASRGALTLTNQKFYTPVCLRMGAALCAMPWDGELQLSITHRLSGISHDDARELGNMLVGALAPREHAAAVG